MLRILKGQWLAACPVCSSRVPAGGWDERTPFWRNQLQAAETACLHLAAGTGENAQTPTTCPGALCRGSGALSRCTSETQCWAASNSRRNCLPVSIDCPSDQC